jgi:hypothetical protein
MLRIIPRLSFLFLELCYTFTLNIQTLERCLL